MRRTPAHDAGGCPDDAPAHTRATDQSAGDFSTGTDDRRQRVGITPKSSGALSRREILARGAFFAATTLLPVNALAQVHSLTTIANLAGADREQRLVEGAKREREISVYTSLTTQDAGAIKDAFEAKYGVKLKVWRAGSEQVIQRVLTEARAGRSDADVLLTNGPALEALHREGQLHPIRSPYLGNVIPEALRPHGAWTATQLNIFVAAYNTQILKKSGLPTTYRDLLDPKWKGKLGIEAEDEDWFAGVATHLGGAEGIRLFQEIVKRNGISVRKGHTLLTNLVASGEVPLALTVYNFTAEQLRQGGAPLDWFVIPPAMARPNGVAVVKTTKNPNAAVLFYDFAISDAQPIFLARGFAPTRKDLDTPLTRFPFKVIGPEMVLDDGEKWRKLYQEMINAQ
jgi:iron(III) transport system substrate-binding protein